MSEDAKLTRKACALIRESGKEWERALPFLCWDVSLGLFLFVGSLGSIAWAAWAHHTGQISALALVATSAFATSVLHELEHDTIHSLWARDLPALQDIMFFGIWVGKLGVSPWFRRKLHLQHHNLSGQEDDAEERLIGLGLPASLKRMAVTCHPMGSTLVMRDVAQDAPWFSARRANQTSVPTFAVFSVLTKVGLTYLFFFSTGIPLPRWLPLSWWPHVRLANLALCVPNVLRQGCLVLMSNTSHYYGAGVRKGGEGLLDQNQMISFKNIFALPAQLLCFGFGATHVLHHLVPQQNFVLRSFVYWSVRDELVNGFKETKGGTEKRGPGVLREDDIASVSRANERFSAVPAVTENKSGGSTSKSNNPSLKDDPQDPWSSKVAGCLWLVACQTLGFALLPAFDAWISFELARTYGSFFIRKYRGSKQVHNGEVEMSLGDLYGHTRQNCQPKKAQ